MQTNANCSGPCYGFQGISPFSQASPELPDMYEFHDRLTRANVSLRREELPELAARLADKRAQFGFAPSGRREVRR